MCIFKVLFLRFCKQVIYLTLDHTKNNTVMKSNLKASAASAGLPYFPGHLLHSLNCSKTVLKFVTELQGNLTSNTENYS